MRLIIFFEAEEGGQQHPTPPPRAAPTTYCRPRRLFPVFISKHDLQEQKSDL
jgi:hypothetical protein